LEKDEIEESLDQEPVDITGHEPASDVSEEKDDGAVQKTGPSVEELAASLKDVQSEIGKKAKEIGDLRQELQYEREMRAQAVREQQRPPAAKPAEDGNKFDIEQPEISIDRRIDQKITSVLTYQQQAAKQAADARAQRNYYSGMRSVDMKEPLFDGIERDVQNMVYHGYQSGIFGVDDLDKPVTWEAAAKIIRTNRDGWAIAPPEKGVKPMKGTQTGETPKSAKRAADDDDTPIDLNDKDHMLLRAFEREGVKITEDQAKKLIRAERATGRRR
jgi:hypothetical protein